MINYGILPDPNAGQYSAMIQSAMQAGQQRQNELAQIDDDEVKSIAANNERTNSTLNMGALASSRRRAGGSTFRRRSSGVSANQLVSGLGPSSAKSLAEQRRKKLAEKPVYPGTTGFTMLGPVMGARYY